MAHPSSPPCVMDPKCWQAGSWETVGTSPAWKEWEGDVPGGKTRFWRLNLMQGGREAGRQSCDAQRGLVQWTALLFASLLVCEKWERRKNDTTWGSVLSCTLHLETHFRLGLEEGCESPREAHFLQLQSYSLLTGKVVTKYSFSSAVWRAQDDLAMWGITCQKNDKAVDNAVSGATSYPLRWEKK